MKNASAPRSAPQRSIFTPSTESERVQNFESYWTFTQRHDGEILEDRRELTRKNELLASFQSNPVRSRKPLPDPELFYRNYVRMKDDPRTFDRKTLLLTFLYKFARHEWVGISAAWDQIPTMAETTKTSEKISRYHLCEEFCHVRLFHEMFRTFHLDRVEWVPARQVDGPRIPALSQVPGVAHVAAGLRQRADGADSLPAHRRDSRRGLRRRARGARPGRALLREIMTDEMAHVGQRRNFIGPIGLRAARLMVEPMYRLFFRDIPESKLLFDVDQMVRDGKAFDYSSIPPDVVQRSWIPSYCNA